MNRIYTESSPSQHIKQQQSWCDVKKDTHYEYDKKNTHIHTYTPIDDI